ncbi:hypothetical protein WJX74_007143 [Apatococcus lobatus]|uniref:Uncharacterized protein n=1 Tax=Apatococcus lobatus TaxID=904363 RepID=A0AAW1QY22_9CHLO
MCTKNSPKDFVVALAQHDQQMRASEAAICQTKAQCKELEQELKRRCNHLVDVRAEAESAEIRETDLKADLEQTRLCLQLTQAPSSMTSETFQLAGRTPIIIPPQADLLRIALLQEQRDGWRECIRAANAKLDALQHREKDDKLAFIVAAEECDMNFRTLLESRSASWLSAPGQEAPMQASLG